MVGIRGGGEGGGGGHSQKNWVGVYFPLPKTLTLFMSKIYDFPYSIYDLIKSTTTAAGTVALNIIYEWLFATGPIDNDEIEASFSKETDCASLHG